MSDKKTMSLKKIQKQLDALQARAIKFPSGLTFNIGDTTLRPDWEDFRRAVWHIFDMGIGHNVLPHNVPEEILRSGNREQLHSLIAYIVETSYKVYGTGLESLPSPRDYYRLSVVLWLIRCYWHYTLGGPKPDFTPTTVFRSHAEHSATVVYTPTYACPECSRRYVPPPHYTKRETITKYFVKWLVKHYNKYHNYSLPEYKG